MSPADHDHDQADAPTTAAELEPREPTDEEAHDAAVSIHRSETARINAYARVFGHLRMSDLSDDGPTGRMIDDVARAISRIARHDCGI